MLNVALVAAGGAIGATTRYLVSLAVSHIAGIHSFPAATAIVNVVGCLAIGLVGGWSESHHPHAAHVWLFLVVGVLGGFTTFSAFGNETIALLRDGRMIAGLANIGLNVVIALVAVAAGYQLMHRT
jgi:CrcB protein